MRPRPRLPVPPLHQFFTNCRCVDPSSHSTLLPAPLSPTAKHVQLARLIGRARNHYEALLNNAPDEDVTYDDHQRTIDACRRTLYAAAFDLAALVLEQNQQVPMVLADTEPPGPPECSICRRRHGSEEKHASE